LASEGVLARTSQGGILGRSQRIMGTLSPIHWVLVAIVVLLLFGPKTLAKMGKSVGQGVRSVNKVKQTFTGDPLRALTAPAPRTPSKRPPAPAEDAAAGDVAAGDVAKPEPAEPAEAVEKPS
jgi:sec-independent protein translocase protein TatA